jgi:putative hydrolase of the HAD superfamily
MHRFNHTRAWIFDLDNTLYPAECDLFRQIDQRMGEFVSRFLGLSFDDAKRLQKAYYVEHGTTLRGLMQEHGLQPQEFLDYVHDIDLSPVAAAPDLCAVLNRLPGRKYIFTNGSRRHAENVAAKLGVLDCFDDVFDIGAASYIPKPDRGAYETMLAKHDVSAPSAAMFEDLPHNLETAHALGMTTVLVKSTYIDHPRQKAIAEWTEPPPHIHHMTDDLTTFLHTLAAHLESLGGETPAMRNTTRAPVTPLS